MGLSLTRDDHPALLRPEYIRVSLWAVFGLWLARRLARLFLLIVRSPSAVIGVTVATAGVLGWQLIHPALPLSVLGATVAGLMVWRVRWPGSFEPQVYLRWRSWWRGQLIYRGRWAAAMDTVGLTVERQGTDYVPTLLKIRSTRSVDRITIKMLAGQTVEDYGTVADRLAQTFGAADCRARSVKRRRHLVELWLLIRDPLEEIVPPFDPDPEALRLGVPVALAEDGTVWRLLVRGLHVLIVGVTGAGKASVIWAIIAGLVPFIRSGLVKLWVVDPKGGVELAPGQHLYARFAHGDAKSDGGYENSLAELLEDAVAIMRERLDRMRGITRSHTPTTDEPLIVLIIDELAALTAWVNDRTVKRRIDSALSLLLSQGRAAGVVVVGAVQDPRKDVIPQRDLFPVRIGLRMSEAEHVTLVLGQGARNRGAYCDLIQDTMPGVGYVVVDGIAEPIRVRFAFHTDADLAELGQAAAPVLALPSPQTDAA